MNLRSKKYYKGYYFDLNNGRIQNSEIAKTTNKEKSLSPSCKSEIKALNYLILKQLRSSRKSSPLISGKFEPSIQLQKYLISRYQLTNKYSCGLKIIHDHKLIIERYFSPRDYCTIYTNINGQSSFKVKLTKPRNLNFFYNLNLDKKKIFYKCILHYKFTVDDKKVKLIKM